jgi:nitrite reductase/ring-hydroxylating ferredoxin subunit
VITQPTAGEFLGFSSICAHQGFDVGTVSDGTITCNVHGSTYDAATGEQTGGPAPEGSSLAPKEIRVKGNEIFLA